MITKYQKGVFWERLTKSWLQREGFVVMRSAGSKGKGDLGIFPTVDSNPDLGFSIRIPSIIQLKCTDDYTSDNIYSIINSDEAYEFSKVRFIANYSYYLIFDNKSKKDPQYHLYKWWNGKWTLERCRGSIKVEL